MIYIYVNFPSSEYWASPFISVANCYASVLSARGQPCLVTNDISNTLPNDLILLFSGPNFGYFGSPETHGKKIIYLNSESIFSRNHIIEDCKHNDILQVWDYNIKNIKNLKIDKIRYTPITYHPSFEHNIPSVTKDIDFLLFGSINNRRLDIVSSLVKSGFNVYAGKTSSFEELINLLSRTKIVIIVHFYPHNLALDFYRLHLLLSNKIFTIHETPSDDQYNKKFDNLIYSDYENFIYNCKKCIAFTPQKRDIIADQIYQWWKRSHPIENYIPNF